MVSAMVSGLGMTSIKSCVICYLCYNKGISKQTERSIMTTDIFEENRKQIDVIFAKRAARHNVTEEETTQLLSKYHKGWLAFGGMDEILSVSRNIPGATAADEISVLTYTKYCGPGSSEAQYKEVYHEGVLIGIYIPSAKMAYWKTCSPFVDGEACLEAVMIPAGKASSLKVAVKRMTASKNPFGTVLKDDIMPYDVKRKLLASRVDVITNT